jgi:hypothetical protein
LPCFAHSIQLAVQQALKLPEVAQLLDKVKSLIRLFRKSPLRTDKLHLVLKNDGEKEVQVLSWSKTRWGSLLVALRRLIDLRFAILQIRDDEDIAFARDAIREKEWRELTEMCKILKPVETMSQSQGGQKYPTLSSCLILLRHGLNMLRNPLGSETETVEKFRETLREALKTKVKWNDEEASFIIMANDVGTSVS